MGQMKEGSYRRGQKAILFRIKEVLKSRTREALPSLKSCDKRIAQTETSKVNNVAHYSTLQLPTSQIAITCYMLRH